MLLFARAQILLDGGLEEDAIASLSTGEKIGEAIADMVEITSDDAGKIYLRIES